MSTEEYRKKIDGMLSKVSKGEEVYPKEKVNPTYEKIKQIGGVKKGLVELFKMEESAFDVPHYINEETEDQISGSSYYRVTPPSNHKDADKYWFSVEPHLKRIGKVDNSDGYKQGVLDLEVLSEKGEKELLRISLVRDEESGERPTLMFQYVNRDDLTPHEVSKFIEKCGLKADRLSGKNLKGIVFMDAV